jgi:hypothetical protein
MTNALSSHEGNPEEQDSAEKDSAEDAEPTAERQGELRAAYAANVAAGNPPYVDVPIRTRGNCAGSCASAAGQGRSLAQTGPIPRHRLGLRPPIHRA